MELGKTIIKGKIRIMSPVHIGGAQEKHLQSGIDYITKDGMTYFLDERALMAKMGVLSYSNSLANNSLKNDLINLKIALDEVSKFKVTISGQVGTDIKMNIKNVLSGKPIIPGSSLKGAIRSVFVHVLGGARSIQDRNGRPKTVEPFGQIHEDINRYMIVADSEFNETTFVNTKTYNLRGTQENSGGWKHELRGHTSEKFNDEGFTFPHESINLNDFGDLYFSFNRKALSNAENAQKRIKESNEINKGKIPKQNVLKSNESILRIYKGDISTIFDYFKKYMNTYLEKEIAFFKKYDGENSDKIIEYLKYLLEENKEMPIIRLGLGSGFHSMTGDPYDSHEITDINRRGLYNGKNSAKSRKIAFFDSGDELQLMPMGFVQLMTDEYYNEHFKKQHEEKLKKNLETRESARQAEIIKQYEIAQANDARIKAEAEAAEEAKLAAEEAHKPKMTDASVLKKAKWVDGIVVGQNGKMLRFKPFVSGYQDKVFEIFYAVGMPVDTVIQVQCFSPNGKSIQFQGAPKLKNG